MVDRIAVALLIVATLGLLGLSVAASAEGHSPGVKSCQWANSPSIGEVKKMAKKAWRKANGPGKRQQQLYRRAVRCAPHAHNVKSVWKGAKAKYAGVRERKRLWRKCGNNGGSAVNACIDYAARYEGGADGGWMHRIASCESGKNPYAQNPSGASGLYQFMPGTWGTTPHGSKSIWKARWQALAAAWMYRAGRAGEWVCR